MKLIHWINFPLSGLAFVEVGARTPLFKINSPRKPPMRRSPKTLQAQIAAVKAEIEKAKLAKLEAEQGNNPPAALDQYTMRYEDIQVHPDDLPERQAIGREFTRKAQLAEEYRKRQWYLKMVDYGPP